MVLHGYGEAYYIFSGFRMLKREIGIVILSLSDADFGKMVQGPSTRAEVVHGGEIEDQGRCDEGDEDGANIDEGEDKGEALRWGQFVHTG